MARSANPKDFLEVLEDADNGFARETALCGEHVHVILCVKPADAMTGSEPNAAFGGDADRLRFQAGQAIGNGPEAEIVRPVGVHAEQATFGGEIDFAPGIEGQCGLLAERIVGFGEGELVKDTSLHVRDATRSDNPDAAGGSQNELVHIGAGKALRNAEALNASTVEAK